MPSTRSGTGVERDDLVRSRGERTGRKSGRFGGHKLGHCTHNELGVAGTWVEITRLGGENEVNFAIEDRVLF
jgi:hypothetical protein